MNASEQTKAGGTPQRVAVIGAGSWGTAIAQLLAGNGHAVALWAHSPATAQAINETRHNPRYLVDSQLRDGIRATSSFEEAVAGAGAVVVVTPSKALRETAAALAGVVDEQVPVVVCSKGVEQGSGLLPAEVLADEMGGMGRMAVLSGPNHAEEVVRGVPAATVIASESGETAALFRDLFACEAFRPYTSADVRGVELCAAYKNVIAIAVGVSYGLGFGDNTAALLVSRGLAEMSRLVVASGGQALTCMGLAGSGDLVATCMSRHSRNRCFGEALAAGTTLAAYEERTHMVAEGAQACRNMGTLASRHGLELPICDAVRKLVWEGAEPAEMGHLLATRPLKPELYGV